jgi:hypothetical protein
MKILLRIKSYRWGNISLQLAILYYLLLHAQPDDGDNDDNNYDNNDFNDDDVDDDIGGDDNGDEDDDYDDNYDDENDYFNKYNERCYKIYSPCISIRTS